MWALGAGPEIKDFRVRHNTRHCDTPDGARARTAPLVLTRKTEVSRYSTAEQTLSSFEVAILKTRGTHDRSPGAYAGFVKDLETPRV